MGLLVEGRWQDQWYESKDGTFQREQAQRRHWITADGSAGPPADTGFAADSGRSNFYVSLACPWPTRPRIIRTLTALQPLTDFPVVPTLILDTAWTSQNRPGPHGA